MPLNTTTIIRLLTGLSLSGLLLAVGLRLTWQEVRDSLRRGHLGWLLPVNFVAVPLLTLGLIRALQLPGDIGAGMILLAAAPFAPVVPIFARMCRANLALAAGLTALFPFASSFLTPVICQLSLSAMANAQTLRFSFLPILAVLIATITLPLGAGIVIRHTLPRLARATLRPVEISSEAVGAVSLAFVTFVEFKTIAHIGFKPLLAMTLASEIGLALGYALSGPTRDIRRVTALGTSNRNIALALLVAVSSFPDTPVVGAVVANGLLIILLGLIHVAWWRFGKCAAVSP
jgi:BASS family bile acid:Na+ symporter